MKKQEKKKANRKRKHRLYFSATEKEKEKIEKKIEKSKMTKQDFLLKMALEKEIKVVPKEELAKIIIELSRQGNNLNQIAKKLNQGSQGTEELKMLWELSKEMDKVWQQLRQYLLTQV